MFGRLSFLIGSLSVLLVLGVAVGCGDDPTPTPTSAPTATPTATPPPALVIIEGLATPGFDQHIEAMRRIVEDNALFARFRFRQPAWVDTMDKEYVELAKAGVPVMAIQYSTIMQESLLGLTPWLEPDEYQPAPVGVIGMGAMGCLGHATIREDILTVSDFDGKKFNHRIQLPDTGTNTYMRHFELAGVELADEFFRLGNEKQELLDEVYDGTHLPMINATFPFGFAHELMVEKRLYVVDAETELLEALVADQPERYKFMFPFPLYQGDLPDVLGLDYDPIREPVAYCYGGNNPHWVASPDVPEDVMYDLVFAMMDNKEEFRNYLTGDVDAFIAGLPNILETPDEIHPGARRAYEELGVPYGLSATVSSEQERARAHGLEFFITASMQARLDAS